MEVDIKSCIFPQQITRNETHLGSAETIFKERFKNQDTNFNNQKYI